MTLTDPSLFWLILILAVCISALLAWLWAQARTRALLQPQIEHWQQQAAAGQAECARLQTENQYRQQEYQEAAAARQQLQQELNGTQQRLHVAETENRQLAPLKQQWQEGQAQIRQLQEQQQQQHGRLAATQQQLHNWQAKESEWQQLAEEHRQLQEQYRHNHGRLSAAQQELQSWQAKEGEWQQLAEEHRQLQQQYSDVQLMHERLHTQLQQEREAHAEKLALLDEARATLSQQFKNLANEILEEKSQRFSSQNQQQINQLLQPLHERMQGFSQLIQNTYEKETKERGTLEAELKRLQQLNTQLHSDAKALTDALTGVRNKQQGNWGEMILETVLENSGLQKGREYRIQAAATRTDDDGQQRRLQPDVLIDLPDNKQIIIDAKVSLTAYVRYTQAEDADTAARELAAHVQSVRQHIKGLAGKSYSDIDGLHTLDFVFMFIPVEPAYLLALQQDNQLFDECFQQRIMLVGPSTLLATLRTVANIWRNEQQNQNALAIASEGGKLLDKFVGFVTTLEGVGKNISQAQNAYQTAMKQLKTGPGNLVRRAEKLRELGVKSTKKLPAAYAQYDDGEDETIPALPAQTDTDSIK
ncbi:DNA recombination protein RmuC [Neisseria sp. HSC-16F19]|nr:DNA recombination protein RmuC [Neisseria sp. HSC-16F19]MCP2039948.1 DNA recombination protein RmuC [Neisseria sp. HSC-16F19]